MFKYIDELTLKNTTLSEAVSSLLKLKDTIFEVGDCDNIRTFDFQILFAKAIHFCHQYFKDKLSEKVLLELNICNLYRCQFDVNCS